ncbi:MAG: hypothetical protein IIZ06_04580, partial [Kiritimatiellae bacterium]|nr:hypothetical protein [Kiritimatiellia bacterium]
TPRRRWQCGWCCRKPQRYRIPPGPFPAAHHGRGPDRLPHRRRHPPEPPKADGIEVPPEPEPPSAKKLEAEDKALRGFISGMAPAADAAKKYADLLTERDALRALMAEACAATSSLMSAAQDAAALADARLAEEEARRRQELAALEAAKDETAGRIAKLRKLLGMK